jgi:hypothetical protein
MPPKLPQSDEFDVLEIRLAVIVLPSGMLTELLQGTCPDCGMPIRARSSLAMTEHYDAHTAYIAQAPS